VPQDGVRDIPDVSLFAPTEQTSLLPHLRRGDRLPRDDYRSDDRRGSHYRRWRHLSVIAGDAAIMALVDQSQRDARATQFRSVSAGCAGPLGLSRCQRRQQQRSLYGRDPNCTLDTNGDGFYTLQEYAAGAGYSQASGLGSIDANNLIANWNKIKFTRPRPRWCCPRPVSRTDGGYGDFVGGGERGGTGTPAARLL